MRMMKRHVTTTQPQPEQQGRRQAGARGFTLLELLVVTSIIGILLAIALHVYHQQKNRARVAAVASELRSFATSFYAYGAEHGDFPNDADLALPAGMEKLIPVGRWEHETKLGGFFDWEGPDAYPYAGIALVNSPASVELLQMLDRMLDDGDLAAGRFRISTGGRPTYILQDGTVG